MGSHLWSSAEAALVAVGGTVIVIICGAFLAKYRATAGGPGSWTDLARVTAEFLMPCLVIASFTAGVTPALLVKLWPVVVLSFVLPCLWLAVGGLGGWLLFSKSQPEFIRFAAVTVAYPNALALPIALMPALIREVPWLRKREGAEDFSVTVCMLFSLFLLLQIWTVGFAIYGAAGRKEGCSKSGDGHGRSDHEEAGNAEHDCSTEAPGQVDAAADRSFAKKLGHYISKAAESCFRAIHDILNPLVLALLLALAVAVSPVRSWFVGSVVHDTLKAVGSAAVPLQLVQLGAGMSRPPEFKSDTDALHWRDAVAIVILRLVVANVAGSAVVTYFHRVGWLEDRLVTLCMYLACCAPTAVQIGLLSSVRQAFVQPTAVVLFFEHIASVLTIIVSTAVYVELLS